MHVREIGIACRPQTPLKLIATAYVCSVMTIEPWKVFCLTGDGKFFRF